MSRFGKHEAICPVCKEWFRWWGPAQEAAFLLRLWRREHTHGRAATP